MTRPRIAGVDVNCNDVLDVATYANPVIPTATSAATSSSNDGAIAANASATPNAPARATSRPVDVSRRDAAARPPTTAPTPSAALNPPRPPAPRSNTRV